MKFHWNTITHILLILIKFSSENKIVIYFLVIQWKNQCEPKTNYKMKSYWMAVFEPMFFMIFMTKLYKNLVIKRFHMYPLLHNWIRLPEHLTNGPKSYLYTELINLFKISYRKTWLMMDTISFNILKKIQVNRYL